MWHVWREGMPEWKRAFEVPEVKEVIMEGRGEVVLDQVVQGYLAKNNMRKSTEAGGV
jgi:HIV Tat-specific factor 1